MYILIANMTLLKEKNSQGIRGGFIVTKQWKVVTFVYDKGGMQYEILDLFFLKIKKGLKNFKSTVIQKG